MWSPSWLLYVPQENGSRLEAAHLLLAPEPSGEEAGHQVKSRQRPWFRRVGAVLELQRKGGLVCVLSTLLPWHCGVPGCAGNCLVRVWL